MDRGEHRFLHWRLQQKINQHPSPRRRWQKSSTPPRWIFSEREKDGLPFSFRS